MKKIIRTGLSVLIPLLFIKLIVIASIYWIWGDVLRIHDLADVIGWDNIKHVELKGDKLDIEIYCSYGYPKDENAEKLKNEKEHLSNIKNQILANEYNKDNINTVM